MDAAATVIFVNADIHRLVDQLTQSSQEGKGVHLLPQDVDMVLAVLKAHAGMIVAPKIKLTSRTFQIELLDKHGWPGEVLAVVRDGLIARAAFDAAVNQRSSNKIRLRIGARIVAESEKAPEGACGVSLGQSGMAQQSHSPNAAQ
jgi:hypothetical protein